MPEKGVNFEVIMCEFVVQISFGCTIKVVKNFCFNSA